MQRLARVAAVVAGAALAVRCGSSPPSPSCTYTVTPGTFLFVPSGTPVTLTISTGASCSWTAASNVTWAAVLAPPTPRTGSGTVQIGAAPNTGTTRNGTLIVAGRTITFIQEASQTFSLAGKVTETWTGVGMAGARVTFVGGPGAGTTTTDRDGTYTLGLAPGDYQIQVSRPAFQTATMIISMSGDKTVNTNLNVNRPFPLPPYEVIGFWEGGGLYPDQPMFMTLIREGEAISGWYRDQHTVSDGLTGTYSGRTLTFRVPVADGVLTYECTVDDERRMHGLVKNERFGSGNTTIWFIRD